ncbi:MAG: hypothetical protein U0169_06690 [Polyangiaceae bacterium]
MIGRSLNQRHSLAPLSGDVASKELTALLRTHARPIIEVRAKGASMIVVAVVRATTPVVKRMHSLGIEVREGATALFGLDGEDAAGLFPEFGADGAEWFRTPAEARETKILLFAGGTALASIRTEAGEVSVEARGTPVP